MQWRSKINGVYAPSIGEGRPWWQINVVSFHLSSTLKALGKHYLDCSCIESQWNWIFPSFSHFGVSQQSPCQRHSKVFCLASFVESLRSFSFSQSQAQKKMREMDTEQWASLNIRWISEIKWPSENVFSRNKIFITLTKYKNTFLDAHCASISWIHFGGPVSESVGDLFEIWQYLGHILSIIGKSWASPWHVFSTSWEYL